MFRKYEILVCLHDGVLDNVLEVELEFALKDAIKGLKVTARDQDFGDGADVEERKYSPINDCQVRLIERL